MTSDPVHDAVVVVSKGVIEGVFSRQEFSANFDPEEVGDARDYKEAIIMPGLINMHSHLDYAAARAFETGSGFFGWLRHLIETVKPWSEDRWLQSALYGTRLAALAGTSTIVDSTKTGNSAKAIAEVGLRALVGLELFGVFDADTEGRWAEWLTFYARMIDPEDDALRAALQSGRIRLTVSPHAPYTVCPTLWLKAMVWAAKEKMPVLAHLAESVEECEWIAEGNATVDRFLQFATTPDGATEPGALPKWQGRGHSPVRHLKNYGLLNDNLIAAHMVQVDDEDIQLITEARVKVAHCPRSNARLRCGAAPIEKFIERKIPFAIGTDSLASCDDLNMISEAQFALNMHRSRKPDLALSAREITESMTIRAAELIGMDQQIGSLEVGKLADLAVFALPPSPLGDSERKELDPYNLLICGGARLRDLLVDGRFVVTDGKLSRKD